MGFFTKRSRTQFFRDEDTGEVKGTRHYTDKDIDTDAMGKDFDEQTEAYPIKKGHAGKSQADIDLDEKAKKQEEQDKYKEKREKLKEKQDKVEAKRKHVLKKLEAKTKLTKSKTDLRKSKGELRTARRENIRASLSPITGTLGSIKGHAVSLKGMVDSSEFLSGKNKELSIGGMSEGGSKESFFDFGARDKFDFSAGSNKGEIDFGTKGGGIFSMDKGSSPLALGSSKDKNDQKYDISLGKVDFSLAFGAKEQPKKKRRKPKKKKAVAKKPVKKSKAKKKGKKKSKGKRKK